MGNIRHTEKSRDSLYRDLANCLDTIYELWINGDSKLRFVVPVLCAIKLEAFINVAGKLNIKSWDGLERKLGFLEKCRIICEIKNIDFDKEIEPNNTALKIFETRNALVHPKMKTAESDEIITQSEYEAQQTQRTGVDHHLRMELNEESVTRMKEITDQFVNFWGVKLIEDPEFLLDGGAHWRYTAAPD